MKYAVTDLFSSLGVAATLGDDSFEPKPLRYDLAPTPKLLMHAETYEKYHPQIDIRGARRHPDPLVESASLAAIRAPRPTVRPKLEPALIARGILSNEQLEGIIYAQQAFRARVPWQYTGELPPLDPSAPKNDPASLPRGYSINLSLAGGFMIADGMGTGKTRTGLGVIRSEWHDGRHAHVWISLKSKLIAGIKTGWSEIFGDPDEVTEWTSDERHTHGIRYTSYASLVRRTLDRFITTLGDIDEYGICRSFEGVIVLDEAHAGMNADPVGSEFDLGRSASQRGRMIVELQERLPNAKVLYLTGTNAERVDALGYAIRLGHIGPGTSFPDNRAFTKSIGESGVVAAEAVCQSLKAQGRLLARTLSFEGVEYDRRIVRPNKDQIDAYNDIAELLRELDRGFADECVRLGAALPPQGRSRHIFQAKLSPYKKAKGVISCFRTEVAAQAINSIMLPEILGTIQEKLSEGKSIVLQISRTGAAALERAVAKLDPSDPNAIETMDVTHRSVVRNLILEHYPIHRYQILLDEKKQPTAHLVFHDGKPIVDDVAVANRNRLLAMIDKAIFPDLGHDLVREFFGDLVGEYTGRTTYITRVSDADGVPRRVLVKRTAKDNERDLAAFRAGTKRIMIISDAGGTGLDLHASTHWPNQERRVHIIADLGNSATSESQKFARTHRTGQVSQPEYVLFVTSLPAHARLISNPTRKMAQLGALSRGHREAVGGGIFTSADNLETRYGREALQRLLSRIKDGEHPTLSADEIWNELGIDVGEAVVTTSLADTLKAGRRGIMVKDFLSRMMTASTALDGGFQGRLMAAFTAELESVIEKEMEAGRYDAGLETWMPASATILARERLHHSASGGACDLLTMRVGEYSSARTTSSEARSMYDAALANGNQDFPAFYDTGKTIALVRESWSTSTVDLRFPGGARTDVRTAILGWTRLSPDEAIERWKTDYAALPITYTTRYFATGDTMSIWTKLGTSVQIVRFFDDTGVPIIGRVIDETEIEAVRTSFGLAAAA